MPWYLSLLGGVGAGGVLAAVVAWLYLRGVTAQRDAERLVTQLETRRADETRAKLEDERAARTTDRLKHETRMGQLETTIERRDQEIHRLEVELEQMGDAAASGRLLRDELRREVSTGEDAVTSEPAKVPAKALDGGGGVR